jgi:hypothetical protein
VLSMALVTSDFPSGESAILVTVSEEGRGI